MTEEAQFPYLWYPQNRLRQKQMERLYGAALTLFKAWPTGTAESNTAASLTDLYTHILSINQMGDQLPTWSAQLAFEAALADAHKPPTLNKENLTQT
jgi:hypothetical protein